MTRIDNATVPTTNNGIKFSMRKEGYFNVVEMSR